MAEQKHSERLDKAIAAQTTLSRKQVHLLCSRGQILLNGEPVKRFDTRIDLTRDQVTLEGRPLQLQRHSYLMLYKPTGVVCATEDAAWPTVLDLVPEPLRRSGLFPAGRLDRDTTGFVLITNDGTLAHRVLAPKSHLPKTYLAGLDKPVTDEMIAQFAAGLVLAPERGEQRGSEPAAKPRICMSATLSADPDDPLLARVVLRQGLYHQVKRMFAACDRQVRTLHREQIGGLALDPALAVGACRALTPDELARLLDG